MTESSVEKNLIPKRFPIADGDMAVLIMREVGDMVIHLIAEGDGRFDESRLQTAISALMDAQPVLGCRLELGWRWHHWVRRDDLSSLNHVRVVVVEEEKKEEALVQAMVPGLDPEKDPLVQAVILRGATDTLCLRVSHVIADAGGTKQLAYQLSDFYRQLAWREYPDFEPNLHGDRETTQLNEQFGWRDLGRIWKRLLHDVWLRGLPKGKYRLPTKSAAPAEKTYQFARLSEEEFRMLKARCRSLNVTFNDLWIAAHMRAVDRFHPYEGKRRYRFQATADLRRYLPSGEGGGICNLSGFIYLNLGTSLGETFEETARRLHKQTSNLKQNLIGLGDLYHLGRILRMFPAAWTESFLRFGFRNMYKAIAPPYTNMGQVDPQRFVFDDVRLSNVFTTASVTWPPFYVSGVTGFGERMTLSAGFCQSSWSKEENTEFFRLVLEELGL
jgi:NRPS condensation-like uncharacterized protein